MPARGGHTQSAEQKSGGSEGQGRRGLGLGIGGSAATRPKNHRRIPRSDDGGLSASFRTHCRRHSRTESARILSLIHAANLRTHAAINLNFNCSDFPHGRNLTFKRSATGGERCGYAASLGQRKRVAHIPTAEAEAARSGLILEGQGQARLHLKSKDPWSHEWGPVHIAARTLARSPICDQLHRRLQPFRHLHDCSGCFRLERLPGGACTHWKAPPSHGAHVKRTLQVGTMRVVSGECPGCLSAPK